MKSRLLNNEQAMLGLGGQLLQDCKSGGVITLTGDLGAGKTTLVRGALRGLGFDGHVRSPTYTLIEPYPFSSIMVVHLDLYRLAEPEELEYLGIRDYLNEQTVCLVEWPQMASPYFDKADLALRLDYHPEGRLISGMAHSDWGAERLSRLV